MEGWGKEEKEGHSDMLPSDGYLWKHGNLKTAAASKENCKK